MYWHNAGERTFERYTDIVAPADGASTTIIINYRPLGKTRIMISRRRVVSGRHYIRTGGDFLSDVHFSDFVTLRSRRTARAQ